MKEIVLNIIKEKGLPPEAIDLNREEVRILEYIGVGSYRTNELSAHFRMKMIQMYNLLRRLEKKEYITRKTFAREYQIDWFSTSKYVKKDNQKVESNI
jgi:DNA-binding MarR family transcriptional regulator